MRTAKARESARARSRNEMSRTLSAVLCELRRPGRILARGLRLWKCCGVSSCKMVPKLLDPPIAFPADFRSVECLSRLRSDSFQRKMGPPPPAGEEKVVIMRAIGGEVGSAASLAPKLGPLGLSPKKVRPLQWKMSEDARF
eukprot:scaffold263_cov251-Pinguiococcus_pyrenoidosus.AAC.17